MISKKPRRVATGGQYTPPISVPYDANTGVRNGVFRGCMYGDGRSPQTPGDDPSRGTAAPIQPTYVYTETPELRTRSRQAAEGDCTQAFYNAPNNAVMSEYDNDYQTCIRIKTIELEPKLQP
jgi:hypothetical protein